MQQLLRSVMLGIALQASAFELEAVSSDKQCSVITMQNEEGAFVEESSPKNGYSVSKCKPCKSKHYGPTGAQGATGPQGSAGLPFGEFASFFLTTSSGDVDVTPGENLIFNNQVALSGIGYDSDTGIFTLGAGTYSVIYFFAPFGIPAVNMYVNDQLILNSPLGGSSTLLTLTEPSNTLTLQYISTDSFAAPGANQSWASIAIYRIY